MMNEVIRCYPTRIHELLELELNEKFKIKNYDGEYYLAASGLLYETQNHREPVKQQMITILINDPELIERKSRKAKLTNEQVDILKGLNALGFNYLIYIYEKEDSYTMYATANAPSWKNGAWDLNGSKAVINLSVHCPAFVLICLMGLVTIYNKEPFFIRQALIDNGVGWQP